MKKLMFATALVASAAAFADAPTAINATSFEGYSAGAIIANGGDVVESGAGGSYFCFTGGDADGSLVKAFGGENLTAPGTRTAYYAAINQANQKYLELSTEGGTLWRSINTIGGTSGAYTLGSETNVAANGTYFDALVQFTPTEDGGGPTDLEADVDKLAIWLNVDQQTGATNLMARAGWYDVNAIPIATNFVLTGKTVVAGEWYRLTVKAIDNIIDTTGMYESIWKIPAFVIYIDGIEMASAVPPIDASLADLDGAIADEFKTLVSAGKVFPSLVVGTCGVPSKLKGVGFKGSGALDDIVWTEEDPLAGSAGGDNYQVTIGDAVVPITLSAEDVTALGTALFDAGFTGTDLTTPAGVNAALALEIGSSGIPAWQAFFLGLPLTEAGLESFKITSISFDENGKVVVTVPASVTLLTDHGVNIVLSLQGSDDLSTWSEIETAAITNNKPSFEAVTPGNNETKKFYKIVVSFVQTPVVQ